MNGSDTMIKKIISALLAAAFAFGTAGCSRSQKDPVLEEDPQPVESTAKPEEGGNVQIVDHSVPDFLAEAPKADVLADVSYRSFDPAAILTEPERQPITGYRCTGFFNNMCYIYKTGEFYGLLSLSGEVLLDPEGITKITPESPEILSVRTKDGSRKLYHIGFDGVIPIQAKKFDIERISFDADEDETSWTLRIDGKDLESEQWRTWKNFTQADLETLNTENTDSEHKYEAVFLAENARGTYYLAFDRYCNLTVSRAELGSVELRIGELYGSFYVTDPEAYQDLTTLVSAFGNESAVPALPKGESSADYVRLVFGREGDPDKSVYTISPDGYCFTELSSGENGSRFFRKFSTDTFTDLVFWTEMKLSGTGAKN